MSKEILLLQSSDPRFCGNWWPFPPPDEGIFDLRRVLGQSPATVPVMIELYPQRRVYLQRERYMTMGQRLSKMTPLKGWQFRFPVTAVQYRPMVVLYRTERGQLVRVEKRDVSDQLPRAMSKDEALYIVRSIPVRFPMFQFQHVEYTEEMMT